MSDVFHEGSLEASLDELKTVYRVIAEHQAQYPELEGNGFLENLRALLEDAASAEGVDVDDPHEWAAWLRDVADEDAEPAPRQLLN